MIETSHSDTTSKLPSPRADKAEFASLSVEYNFLLAGLPSGLLRLLKHQMFLSFLYNMPFHASSIEILAPVDFTPLIQTGSASITACAAASFA